MKYIVANPHSVLLALAHSQRADRLILIEETVQHRTSGRSLALNFEIAKFFMEAAQRDFISMDLSTAIELINSSEETCVVEQRIISHAQNVRIARAVYSTNQIQRDTIALTYAVDILLAGASKLTYLYGLRQAVTNWRWAMHVKSMKTKVFIIPEQSKPMRRIGSASISFIRRQDFNDTVRKIYSSALFEKTFPEYYFLRSPTIIVSPDLEMNERHIFALRTALKSLARKQVSQKMQVLFKPHPGSSISVEFLNEIERRLDVPLINKKQSEEIEKLKAFPLEFLLASNDGNYYVGVQTAGVAFQSRSLVKIVSTGSKYRDKMSRINTRTFNKHW